MSSSLILELVPLLRLQRELYEIPRGWERFHAYLQTMTDGTNEAVLPLAAMNPMGKAHVAETLDALIALEAETVAREALEEASERLAAVHARLRIHLVVADDAHGAWTNRHLTEVQHRFERTYDLRKGWSVALLWTSEEYTAPKVREEVLASVYRTLYQTRRGSPNTLREMMTQEGLVARFSGASGLPTLEEEELAYTRHVIAPHLDSTHFPTVFACLHGDEIARSLGYPALGLSEKAGYALALADARERGPTPEAALLEL